MRQIELEFAPLAARQGPRPRLRARVRWWCAPTAACCAGWCRTSSPTRSNTRRPGACWSAAAGAATSCASTSTTPASAFRNRSSATFSWNSTASIRAPGSRAGWAWACRSWSASRACSTARSSVEIDGRPRLAFLGHGAAVERGRRSSCRRATTSASMPASSSAPPRFASTTNASVLDGMETMLQRLGLPR